jgi:hypothetical protein
VGSIEIRLNGASTNTITATNVNTRGGTTNSYVTGLALVAVGGASMKFDNLYLTNSGWLGEMRALQQRPTTISGTPNFSLNPTTINATLNTNATAVSYTANTAYFARYTAPYSGTVGSLTFLMNTNLTGNVKFAIYDSTGSGGTPGAVIRTTNAVNNPTTATNTATFSSSFSIIAGTLYYLAWDQDTTGSFRANSSGSTGYSLATSYASFPVSNPAVVTTILSSIFITIPTTLDNAAGVQDLIQDSDTTYIYTSAANVEDKYNLSSIATTYTVSAVQYFAMWKKTDAGFRTASLSVDANGSGDTNLITTTLLPFADYACTIKTMELDPTGAAWTPTNANNALLGVTAGS